MADDNLRERNSNGKDLGCPSKRKKNSRTYRIYYLKDERGIYIPYCTLEHHEGILKNGQPRRCKRINCSHYLEFRA